MHRTTRFALILFLPGIIASTASATMFSGSLSSAAAQIMGTGAWMSAGETSVAWEVTDHGTHYHYKYVFTVPSYDVSHFIIEVSPLADIGDFAQLEGPFQGMPEINDYHQGNGNPNIPAPLHGMKFDDTSGLVVVFEFDSTRVPVWGDFYSKGGGNPAHQAWNAGFSLPDPSDPAASGTIDNHLLVPDSKVVPEPTVLVFLSIGALMAVRRSRRRA